MAGCMLNNPCDSIPWDNVAFRPKVYKTYSESFKKFQKMKTRRRIQSMKVMERRMLTYISLIFLISLLPLILTKVLSQQTNELGISLHLPLEKNEWENVRSNLSRMYDCTNTYCSLYLVCVYLSVSITLLFYLFYLE